MQKEVVDLRKVDSRLRGNDVAGGGGNSYNNS